MDLDDALLGLDKMPSSWTPKEKQRKDRKTILNSSSSIKSNSIGQSKRENRRCIMVKVGAIVHDEKSN